ncbi:hypothetical protein HKK72_36780, partial [Actinomadura sp. HBU206391]|nr:hypothetical protein [Actinomadura sp. HBU206391]
MNGDESGGPAERDEHTLVDQQPTGETWPSGGIPADEPVEGAAETTVTDDPLEPETETTAEAGFFDDSDPWPDLADVTEEEPWDPATLPQPGSSAADLDRRVAPEPPAMVEMSVAMAAAAPRQRPVAPADEAGPVAPPAPADPAAPDDPAPADPALADPTAQVNPAAPVGLFPPAAPAGPVASMHEAPPPPPLALHGPAMGTPPGGVPHPLGGTPPGGIPHPLATNALPDRRPPGSGSRLPKILIGVAAGLVVVVIGVLATVVLSSSGSERSGAAAASPNETAPATPEGSGGPSGSPGAEPTSTAPGSPTPGAGQVPVQPSGPVTAPSSGAPAGT